MPFIPNIDQDQEQPLQGAIAPGAGGTRLSPGGVGSAPSTSSAPTPQGAGGQFATLQSYLSANQGQAAPLAGKITSGIQNQYNTLEGQNASTLGNIGNQVTANSVPTNANDIIAQEAANPVSFAGDQGNVKQFQSLLNATYGGPTSAESTPEYQKQQAAVNNAIATGTAQTGTEAGREQLLSQNERRPTTGVTALNSAILTQSPDYLNQVQSAYKPFSNLVSGLSTGAQNINQSISKTQSDVTSANAAANKQIKQQTQDLQSNIQNALANEQQAINKYNQDIAIGQNTLSPLAQQANIFGGIAGMANVGFNDVNNPFATAKPITNQPTIAQIATPQQYQEESALASLVGSGFGRILNPENVTQGGTAPVVTPIANLSPTTFAQEYANAMAKSQLVNDPNAFIASGGTLPTGYNLGNFGTAERDFLKYLQSINPNAVGTKHIGTGQGIDKLVPIYNQI